MHRWANQTTKDTIMYVMLAKFDLFSCAAVTWWCMYKRSQNPMIAILHIIAAFCLHFVHLIAHIHPLVCNLRLLLSTWMSNGWGDTGQLCNHKSFKSIRGVKCQQTERWATWVGYCVEHCNQFVDHFIEKTEEDNTSTMHILSL